MQLLPLSVVIFSYYNVSFETFIEPHIGTVLVFYVTHFDKHLVSHRGFGRFGRAAVDGHGLPVSRELQGELLPHQVLDDLSVVGEDQ